MQLKKDDYFNPADDGMSQGGSSISGGMYGSNSDPGYYSYGTPNQPSYTSPSSPVSSGVQKLVIIICIVILGGLLAYIGIGQYKKKYAKSEYIPGTYSNNVYQNEYFGIQAKFGSGWTVKQYPYDSAAIKKTLDNDQSVIELKAENKQKIAVVGFVVQQTAYNVKESGTDMNKMLDSLEDDFKEEMEASGYTVSSIERDSITIAGEKCEGFKIIGVMGGIKLSLVQYYVFKGNYMGAYTASSTSESISKQSLSDIFTAK